MTLPTILIIITTAIFLIWERIFPGRQLPHSSFWYLRSITINFIQLGITFLIGKLWITLADGWSIFSLSEVTNPVYQGFMGWFIGTFAFYWWHRLRHKKGWWQIFHQVHHSASRIEVLTSFYKHPVEIFVGSMLTTFILFPILGCSLIGGFWYNFFASTGEYFYHANIKTPRWLRYFIQTPELHSVHHQFNVHNYNFSDLPIWDRLFGTYKDSVVFTKRCGFPKNNETKIWSMLRFKDVYND
jgi:sterol desaturase/sphingolipid hydroxylase (fatty acid hydroxylase superfamily)